MLKMLFQDLRESLGRISVIVKDALRIQRRKQLLAREIVLDSGTFGDNSGAIDEAIGGEMVLQVGEDGGFAGERTWHAVQEVEERDTIVFGYVAGVGVIGERERCVVDGGGEFVGVLGADDSEGPLEGVWVQIHEGESSGLGGEVGMLGVVASSDADVEMLGAEVVVVEFLLDGFRGAAPDPVVADGEDPEVIDFEE